MGEPYLLPTRQSPGGPAKIPFNLRTVAISAACGLLVLYMLGAFSTRPEPLVKVTIASDTQATSKADTQTPASQTTSTASVNTTQAGTGQADTAQQQSSADPSGHQAAAPKTADEDKHLAAVDPLQDTPHGQLVIKFIKQACPAAVGNPVKDQCVPCLCPALWLAAQSMTSESPDVKKSAVEITQRVALNVDKGLMEKTVDECWKAPFWGDKGVEGDETICSAFLAENKFNE